MKRWMVTVEDHVSGEPRFVEGNSAPRPQQDGFHDLVVDDKGVTIQNWRGHWVVNAVTIPWHRVIEVEVWNE